jgi:cell division transport system ATP-binding protein
MIEMVHVSKSFRNQPDVLSDINLRVLKGQFLYITGPSGAGKSTLLKLLYAAELPSAGEIWVNGFHIPGLPRRQIPRLRRSLGIVFQDFKLLAQRTVFENVAFALEVLGVDKREIQDRTRKALQLVGLEPKGDFFPAQLSAGEQQRTAIARAIVNEPPLLLADEPTGNIDGAMAEEILRYFDEINARGTTVVLATHNERLPALLPKERIVLERGRILESSIQPIRPSKPEVMFFE